MELLIDASPNFFYQYDELVDASASLALRKTQLDQIQKRHENATQALKDAARNLEQNAANIQEQQDRIQLVSSHWFFGTTAFQPQLWLRGGCEGKIRRAAAKLERAQTEAPNLMASLALVKAEVPPLAKELDGAQKIYAAAYEADQQRASMKRSLVQKYASPKLLSLNERLVPLQRHIQDTDKTIPIREIRALLIRAATGIQTSGSHVRKARTLKQESREQQTEERNRNRNRRSEKQKQQQQQTGSDSSLRDRHKTQMRKAYLEADTVVDLLRDASLQFRELRSDSIVSLDFSFIVSSSYPNQQTGKAALERKLEEYQLEVDRLTLQVTRAEEFFATEQRLANERLERLNQDIELETHNLFESLRVTAMREVVNPSAPVE